MRFPPLPTLRRLCALLLCLGAGVAAVHAGPVEDMIKFVTVGDPRNPDEDVDSDLENSGIGYVGQEFAIGETEVTNEMYARFLNAIAKDDRLYGLYSTVMSASPRGGIIRFGANEAYTYQVKDGFANRPVNYVSGFDAMRFINWLHNGMPVGGQTAATTEDGAYTLLGANSREIIRRNAGAKYFLPDQDEWHKAAYYDPQGTGGASEDYWNFADQTNGGPGGNFSPDPTAPVKTSKGPSHYGTYDQDGNVAEWLDASIVGGSRFLALGGATITASPLGDPGVSLFGRNNLLTAAPTAEETNYGFRVAKRLAPIATGLAITPPTMVEVGEPGNPGDDTGPADSNGIQYRRGRVDYTFQMGAYEVTNEDYAKFLNAVAKDDTFYRLYDSRMQTDAPGGIIRTGSNGSYGYQARGGFAKKPVNFVSLWSAMRYCNWLHNGAQPNGDTEAGAYRLLGNIPPNTSNLIRNPSALYFLPTEDEWYKAAFYDPSVTAEQTANYWSYATRADNAQKSIINYADLFAVDVDAYLAQSYFGTFQQSGNIAEWTETTGRRVLGGSWESREEGISAAGVEAFPPETKSATVGFRIAAAPEALSVKFASDGDNDGMRDAWELLYGLNPSDPSDAAQDADGDGLTNLREFQLGLLPRNADTDADGLTDGAEANTFGTDPANSDTDVDGLSDGAEVNTHRTDPKNADTDGDGLSDGLELKTLGTNPLAPEEIPFFSLVGDPGNSEDYYTEDLRGHVPVEFDMAITEVTNLMYAKFLNAVARQGDAKQLYSPYMKLDLQGGIVRSGPAGAYSYAVKAGFEGKPVGFVSYYDALRYVNWLHNGMPTGQQDLSTTEAGVYRMPDPLAAAEYSRIQRNPDALYFLPDANEWHKAAYYDAGRNPSETYWPFADKTEFGPGGNFGTTAASGGDLIKLADAGTSSGSSRYGTLDQDGNAGEWIEVLSPAGEVPVNFGRKPDGGSGLTLHIDTSRDRLWFTGSASGNFGTRYRRATWSVVIPSLTYDPASSTTSAGLAGDPSQLLAAPSLRGVQSVEIGSRVSFGGFRFTIVGESAGETQLVGRGPEYFVDYSATSSTAEFEFEFPLGNSAAIEVGDSSFGSLAIEFSDWDNTVALAAGEVADIKVSSTTERADVGFRLARAVPPGVLPPPAMLPQLVAVGELRNPGDPDENFAGGVDYTYKIGAYEVTNDEYAAFLNSVAKSDALYGLFDRRMTTSLLGGILRKGGAGSYSYSVKPGFGRKPVVFVSSYDAMRYCNWLHNGAQEGSDTESGAYRLLGELSPGDREVRRSFGARYFLPSKDEWSKAAYYDSSASAELTGNYWQFAIRADNATPSQVAVGGTAGLVDVNKPGVASFFGTFGQSGNAAEWTEELAGGQRLVLGGGVASDWSNPSVAMSFSADPAEGTLDRGFRIAARADSPAARLLSLQTIKFGKLPAKRVIGTKPLKINLRAKASSKLPVTFEVDDPSNVATFHDGPVPYLLIAGPGQVTVTVRQNGGGTWAPAQVRQSMQIVPRAVRTR